MSKTDMDSDGLIMNEICCSKITMINLALAVCIQSKEFEEDQTKVLVIRLKFHSLWAFHLLHIRL